MFKKQKLNFWRLAFITTGFIILVLLLLWNSPMSNPAKMMGQNMGSMMKHMHLSGTTIYSLLQKGSNSQTDDTQSHHQEQAKGIYRMNFITTALIFLMLPFIIGGSLILLIVWIK